MRVLVLINVAAPENIQAKLIKIERECLAICIYSSGSIQHRDYLSHIIKNTVTMPGWKKSILGMIKIII